MSPVQGPIVCWGRPFPVCLFQWFHLLIPACCCRYCLPIILLFSCSIFFGDLFGFFFYICASLQAEPPLYVPSNIQIPVSFFTGGNDALADPTDVAWLKTQINVVHHVDVPWYNHLGPVLAYDAKDLMYPTLVPIITGKPWSPSPSPSSNGITG